MWRAAAMSWVDIMLHRRYVSSVMSQLATSQSFEMQPMKRGEGCGVPEEYRKRLQALQTRVRVYQPFLAELSTVGSGRYPDEGSLEDTLPQLEQAVERWMSHIRLPSKKIKVLEARLFESRFLIQCLSNIADRSFVLETFSKASRYRPFIGVGRAENLEGLSRDSRVMMQRYSFPVKRKSSEEPDTVFVGLFAAEHAAQLERNLRASGVRFARIPSNLRGSPEQAMTTLESDVQVMEKHIEALQSEIAWHSEKDRIATWVRQMQHWLWLVEVMRSAACDTHFVRICGWVPDRNLAALEAALKQSNSPYLLQVSPPQEHGEPPVLLNNRSWLQPFENFVRGFGVPRASEIDPTPVLGLTTPLMFGYMFGDVGQGLVLLVLGYLLRSRLPILALFIPAGLSAMAFGFLYGSIFSYEQLIPPLWLHPMHEPLTVMGIALLFGAALLISSLVLAGVQAYWNEQMPSWAREKLPLLLLALALPIMFYHSGAGVSLLLVAALMAILAAGLQGGARAAVLGSLKFLEDGIQLAMNMLSFIRLGAFTLAHGGLSAAVMVLTLMPDNVFLRLLVFISGNALVIGLEGLVVSIQTTRLIMFEFFRRFLNGSGRPFKPLTDPAIS